MWLGWQGLEGSWSWKTEKVNVAQKVHKPKRSMSPKRLEKSEMTDAIWKVHKVQEDQQIGEVKEVKKVHIWIYFVLCLSLFLLEKCIFLSPLAWLLHAPMHPFKNIL